MLERSIDGRPAYTAVFESLERGAYTLWTHGVPRAREVRIEAGGIAELDWRAHRWRVSPPIVAQPKQRKETSMPNIGPLEIVVVLVIALVVFGPKRLPELGKSMGRGIREFRSTISGQGRRVQAGARRARRRRRRARRRRGRRAQRPVARWRAFGPPGTTRD